jgi:triacylglycerol lipase
MRTTTTWQDLLRPGDARDFFSREPLPPFDPAASAYSRGNAWWLAELSRLVYRHDVEEESLPPQPTRSSFLAKARLRQRRFFASQVTDTQAMLVESERPPAFAVLVFRGTEQRPKDFLSDIEVGAKAISTDGVRVHEGFAKAIDSVWADIDGELATLRCPVFYTGHSLGAALATLAASRRAPRAVYTFGSPLVGNRGFVASLDNVPVYRVVDDSDAVTRVPPEVLGFRHAGIPQLLTEPAVNSAINPLLWFRRLVGPPKPLADHAPINYVDRIG